MRTDITNLTVAFRNFWNAPLKAWNEYPITRHRISQRIKSLVQYQVITANMKVLDTPFPLPPWYFNSSRVTWSKSMLLCQR